MLEGGPNKKFAPRPVETITIEEAAKKERERQEKLTEIRKRVGKTADKLKQDGYNFELEETSDYFTIKVGDRKTHLLKSEYYTLRIQDKPDKDKPDIKATVEEMITADIINPKGSSYETVLKMRSEKEK